MFTTAAAKRNSRSSTVIATEADVRLLNHADVIGAVADGGSGGILRTGLDEAHNLSSHINTATYRNCDEGGAARAVRVHVDARLCKGGSGYSRGE